MEITFKKSQICNFRPYTNFYIDKVYKDICGYIWLSGETFVYSCISEMVYKVPGKG